MKIKTAELLKRVVHLATQDAINSNLKFALEFCDQDELVEAFADQITQNLLKFIEH